MPAIDRLVFKIQFVCPHRGVVGLLALGGGPNGEDLREGDTEKITTADNP